MVRLQAALERLRRRGLTGVVEKATWRGKLPNRELGSLKEEGERGKGDLLLLVLELAGKSISGHPCSHPSGLGCLKVG